MIAQRFRRRRAGFTLMELMITVAIVGILTSISIRNYQGYNDRSNNALVSGNVAKVRVSLEQFAADNNETYPTQAEFTSRANAYTFLRRYMGGQLPKAPWSADPQTSVPTPANMPDTFNAPQSNGTVLATNLRKSTQATGDVPKQAVAFAGGNPGTMANPPSGSNHYGALMYDVLGNNRLYVLYGVGKRAKEAVIVETASNSGL